ncbi:putative ammonium transporter 3 [Haliotis cracherodii]|uniref:putative ammonium transporter 3 n=1 Tax=Haliotis cracherodii TaxID=6455 RepID=UPI0039E7CDB8
MSNKTTPFPSTLSPSGVIANGPITWDDATWILTSAFIIFTMQSGFGLLEAGAVSSKNEVNIMVKNVVDIVFGGLTYWAYGFGFSFGEDKGTNPFCGIGYFFVDSSDENMGIVFSTFVFQLSFATTATTIVSGCMAERTKLISYILFSFFNTIVYCFPAHWVWGSNGFLKQMGSVDFAGSGVVHLVGGSSGLVASLLLKPRLGRYDHGTDPLPMCSPANAIVGTFMLWWGWLAFNCGSTFGISGGKWQLAAKAAVTTLMASTGGGSAGVIISYVFQKRKFDVGYLINSVLGSLVSITASCALVRPWESIVIGIIGAILTLCCTKLLDVLHIDDPVGAVAVHGASGIWGLLAVGLFVEQEPIENLTGGLSGLFHGGGWYLLGIQTLSAVCEIAWSATTTFILLFIIKKTIGLRMDPEEEQLGADLVEHNIGARIGDPILFSPRPSASPKHLRPATATGSDDIAASMTSLQSNESLFKKRKGKPDRNEIQSISMICQEDV